jgi:hypothetical protein
LVAWEQVGLRTGKCPPFCGQQWPVVKLAAWHFFYKKTIWTWLVSLRG